MKNTTVSLFAVMCVTFFALNSVAALAGPLKNFGPLSTKNPNVQNEIYHSTGTTLGGSGKLWSHITRLDVRTGVRFKDQMTLKHIVESLNVLGEGLPWDGYAGGDEVRVYIDNDENGKSPSDLMWYFYRNNKAYCVPALYHWTAGLYKPQRMYPISPAASHHFEALIRSTSSRAKSHKSPFQLINFGGD